MSRTSCCARSPSSLPTGSTSKPVTVGGSSSIGVTSVTPPSAPMRAGSPSRGRSMSTMIGSTAPALKSRSSDSCTRRSSRARGQRARVRVGRVEPERRDAEREQRGGHRERDGRRAALGEGGEPRQEPRAGRPAAPPHPRPGPPRRDAPVRDRDQRGDEGQRGQRGRADGEPAAERHRRQQRVGEHVQRGERDAHRQPGDEHGAARGRRSSAPAAPPAPRRAPRRAPRGSARPSAGCSPRRGRARAA